MGIKLRGAKRLVKTLEVVKNSAHEAGFQALEAGAKKIQKRARDYAPLEYGALEKSIKIKPHKISPVKRRYDVYVDESMPADKRGPDVTVGKYAKYAEAGIPGGIGYGEESQRKAKRLGVKVGPRFMRRAYEELKDEVRKDVEGAIAAAIAGRARRVQQVRLNHVGGKRTGVGRTKSAKRLSRSTQATKVARARKSKVVPASKARTKVSKAAARKVVNAPRRKIARMTPKRRGRGRKR